MYEKKAAMVGTPCQILAATKINRYEKETGGSPVDLKIGLFCMENFSYQYLKTFLNEKNIDLKDVKEFRIENNKFKVFLKNDEVSEFKISETEVFKRKNCDICTDFSSNLSDISVGSVGSDKGFSTIIIRTEKGKKIIEGLIKENYITTKEISEKGLKIANKIANTKKNKNLKNIENRENVSRPVLYKRQVDDNEIAILSKDCQFNNLNSDVIKEGACVLCGACEFICPIDIVQINNKKPVKVGTCKENCNLCYISCPRTFTSSSILPSEIDLKPLGDYIEILSAKSNKVKGQDGGIVTSILLYLLNNNLVEDVFVVGEDKQNPWKPIAELTNNTKDVISASGTKYSTVPIAFKALKSSSE
jgi:coenzyme F420 hydrogenase subunit beta